MMNFEFSKQPKALKFNSKYWWQGNSHESISILRDYLYCFYDVWIQLNSVWSKTQTVYVEMIPSKSVQKHPGQIW